MKKTKRNQKYLNIYLQKYHKAKFDEEEANKKKEKKERHKKYLNDLFSQYDLNLVQVLCLLRLNEENNLNQKDLSDGFYLTKCAITKAVKKLEKNNFIIREKSTSDKRQYTLTLTSKGKNMIPIMEEINAQWENEIGLNEVSEEFNKTFTRLTFKSVELNKNKK